MSNSLFDESHASNWSGMIEQARKGFNGSIDAICARVQPYLRGQCRGQLHALMRSKVGESDIVQDALISISQNFSEFRGQTAEEFLAWASKILQNQRRTIERRLLLGKRDVRLEVTNVASEASQIVGRKPVLDPGSRLVSAEDAIYIRQIVSELPENYQEVIRLRHVEEQTFPQIAELMKSTEPAVKNLYVRAMKKLSSRVQPSS